MVEALVDHFLRDAGWGDHSELVKVFTSTESRHVKEVVSAAREGGASLDILSGLVAGNFSAYCSGLESSC
jgi:hypothetical protein